MPVANITVTTTATLLTSSNVTTCRVQNISNIPILVQAAVGVTPPSSFRGAILLRSGQGLVIVMSEHFAGLTGANRLYARTYQGQAVASVSHA
jgi:hypothetical protein